MKMYRLIALLSALVLLSLSCLPGLADGASYNAYYIIPDSDTRRLTENELWSYTRETLRYIRNELLARYGYAFSMDKFYDYFNAKPWYAAGDYNMDNNRLSKLEWDNISIVKAVEADMDRQGTKNYSGIDITQIIAYQNACGGFGNQISFGNARGAGNGLTVYEEDADYSDPDQQPTPATPVPNYIYNTQYIIPDSDTRRLTANELWAYSRETLRYIRNELLARHGYTFGDNKFGRYFRTKDWYASGGFENAVLSNLEWDNINLVKRIERAMDALGTENSAYLDIETIRQNQQYGTCPGN